MAGRNGTGAHRSGIVVALVVAFLTIWTTIVRDDGGGASFFMIILAVGVGWFAAGFRAPGMARTMVGVAVMQICLGALIVTAPDCQLAGRSAQGLALQRLLLSALVDFCGPFRPRR